MKKTGTLILLTLLLLPLSGAVAWEKYDRVIAVVNSEPIVESEIELRFNYLNTQKKIARKKIAYERSRILDSYIENALVKQTAKEISAIVTDKQVLLHIEKIMAGYFAPKIKDKKKFKSLMNKFMDQLKALVNSETTVKKTDKRLRTFLIYMEKQTKLSFLDYFEDIKNQIRRRHLIDIAIGVTPPADKEAEEWLKKNRRKLGITGYEFRVKHILIRPKGRSFKAERAAAKKIEGLRKQVLKGASFEKLAAKYSQDPGSRAKGGDIGWTMLPELDRFFAGNIVKMNRRGQISRVFKSNFGYHFVKFVGKRPIGVKNPKVKNMIKARLYNEKMMKEYKKWVLRKKRESEIQIYMDNYVALNDSGVKRDRGKRKKYRPSRIRKRRAR